jgi:hypothetical protein
MSIRRFRDTNGRLAARGAAMLRPYKEQKMRPGKMTLPKMKIKFLQKPT